MFVRKRKTGRRILLAVGGAAIALVTGLQLSRSYFEEPEYEVVSREGSFEVRSYPPRIVAETRVQARDYQSATSEGFSRLAGYIFGGNEPIAMTTPVEASPSGPPVEGSRIAMTTPVETSAGEDGWRIAFTMPSEYTLEDLPPPRDERVQLRQIDETRVGTLRFSGRATPEAIRERERELLQRVEAAGLEPTSGITVAVYDPPHWVLPPFRRNEIQVRVSERGWPAAITSK